MQRLLMQKIQSHGCSQFSAYERLPGGLSRQLAAGWSSRDTAISAPITRLYCPIPTVWCGCSACCQRHKHCLRRGGLRRLPTRLQIATAPQRILCRHRNMLRLRRFIRSVNHQPAARTQTLCGAPRPPNYLCFPMCTSNLHFRESWLDIRGTFCLPH